MPHLHRLQMIFHHNNVHPTKAFVVQWPSLSGLQIFLLAMRPGMVVADRYQRYVHLERDYVVWNVFAAPPLSMLSEQWCYPLIGCAPYRGFFDEADARAFAARYEQNGLLTSTI